MGHSRFLALLLVSSLLFLSFGYGFARVALTDEEDDFPIKTMFPVKFETMDYADPEPNINPKNGYIFSPPSPTPTPPPSA
ncbi:uncharacterized protein LOC113863894 isoform X2 [Abrus precatorius]|uniref:Uncharacterized protein LOC113863894 isoform X2 n=1 Tax=Abrus precatorius TaxID=3816 RepID=A0A8B8LFA7_ABRPR|nr:uncharacterized protein LOC113863894 isoform X2 [Abrus precatorius]